MAEIKSKRTLPDFSRIPGLQSDPKVAMSAIRTMCQSAETDAEKASYVKGLENFRKTANPAIIADVDQLIASLKPAPVIPKKRTLPGESSAEANIQAQAKREAMEELRKAKKAAKKQEPKVVEESEQAEEIEAEEPKKKTPPKEIKRQVVVEAQPAGSSFFAQVSEHKGKAGIIAALLLLVSAIFFWPASTKIEKPEPQKVEKPEPQKVEKPEPQKVVPTTFSVLYDTTTVLTNASFKRNIGNQWVIVNGDGKEYSVQFQCFKKDRVVVRALAKVNDKWAIVVNSDKHIAFKTSSITGELHDNREYTFDTNTFELRVKKDATRFDSYNSPKTVAHFSYSDGNVCAPQFRVDTMELNGMPNLVPEDWFSFTFVAKK